MYVHLKLFTLVSWQIPSDKYPVACPGIRKGGGAKIEQLMSCGVPSIKTLYIIIVFFIYLLFVLSFSTFQKKNVLGGGGGGLNHLANSSPLKKN